MQVDIVGRVNNLQLALTQPYIPLLECLVNSIEAIEDGDVKDGKVEIHFERDMREQTLPNSDETFHAPIKNITVIDNGTGFNDVNARTFLMSDSTRKATRGNKGIGRFNQEEAADG
jgi:nitrogen fixation/metabolism regulation signal transduction histidine kinase